ncbi:MAG: hypothetical protein IPL51_08945 [Candidatus Competibacteraceae bacterium]|nr:hypothetical protein [Candidatus Competibacteraceae bacterium]
MLGKLVSAVLLLVSLVSAVLPTLSRHLGIPLKLTITTQYFVPAVTLLAGNSTVFQLPALGEFKVPMAIRAPGRPLLSA